MINNLITKDKNLNKQQTELLSKFNGDVGQLCDYLIDNKKINNKDFSFIIKSIISILNSDTDNNIFGVKLLSCQKFYDNIIPIIIKNSALCDNLRATYGDFLNYKKWYTDIDEKKRKMLLIAMIQIDIAASIYDYNVRAAIIKIKDQWKDKILNDDLLDTINNMLDNALNKNLVRYKNAKLIILIEKWKCYCEKNDKKIEDIDSIVNLFSRLENNDKELFLKNIINKGEFKAFIKAYDNLFPEGTFFNLQTLDDISDSDFLNNFGKKLAINNSKVFTYIIKNLTTEESYEAINNGMSKLSKLLSEYVNYSKTNEINNEIFNELTKKAKQYEKDNVPKLGTLLKYSNEQKSMSQNVVNKKISEYLKKYELVSGNLNVQKKVEFLQKMAKEGLCFGYAGIWLTIRNMQNYEKLNERDEAKEFINYLQVIVNSDVSLGLNDKQKNIFNKVSNVLFSYFNFDAALADEGAAIFDSNFKQKIGFSNASNNIVTLKDGSKHEVYGSLGPVIKGPNKIDTIKKVIDNLTLFDSSMVNGEGAFIDLNGGFGGHSVEFFKLPNGEYEYCDSNNATIYKCESIGSVARCLYETIKTGNYTDMSIYKAEFKKIPCSYKFSQKAIYKYEKDLIAIKKHVMDGEEIQDDTINEISVLMNYDRGYKVLELLDSEKNTTKNIDSNLILGQINIIDDIFNKLIDFNILKGNKEAIGRMFDVLMKINDAKDTINILNKIGIGENEDVFKKIIQSAANIGKYEYVSEILRDCSVPSCFVEEDKKILLQIVMEKYLIKAIASEKSRQYTIIREIFDTAGQNGININSNIIDNIMIAAIVDKNNLTVNQINNYKLINSSQPYNSSFKKYNNNDLLDVKDGEYTKKLLIDKLINYTKEEFEKNILINDIVELFKSFTDKSKKEFISEILVNKHAFFDIKSLFKKDEFMQMLITSCLNEDLGDEKVGYVMLSEIFNCAIQNKANINPGIVKKVLRFLINKNNNDKIIEFIKNYISMVDEDKISFKTSLEQNTGSFAKVF